MLKVNLCDGKTLQFDLADDAQARAWGLLAEAPHFQQSITALTLSSNGVTYSLPRPRVESTVELDADVVPANPEKKIKGGQRIRCTAGPIELTIMVHSGQRAVRIDLIDRRAGDGEL